MNSTRSGHALLGTLLAITLAATGCSESKPRVVDSKAAKPAAASASDAPAEYNMGVSGYPLDRTLDNLVNMRGVDTMVVIEAAELGEPRWIGRAGEGGFPGDAPGATIVTPVDASVSRVLRGSANVGDPIRMDLVGGRLGEYQVQTEDSPPEDIAKYSRLLVAGETMTSQDGFGQILDTWFMYGIEPDGAVTSLMESASDEEPNFTIAELQERLNPAR